LKNTRSEFPRVLDLPISVIFENGIRDRVAFGCARPQDGRSNHPARSREKSAGMIYNFIEVICYYGVEPVITGELRAWEGIRKNVWTRVRSRLVRRNWRRDHSSAYFDLRSETLFSNS
jgi:hypothetical protein